MKKYLFLILIFSVFGNLQVFSDENKDGKRPNIIFILTDDQRWDALGYAGNEIIQTPEMDKLAETGVYFSHAMSSTPICSASRASIFSGLQERTHKYTFQTGPIRQEYMEESYPKLLKEAGYYTGFFGKFGVNYDPRTSAHYEIEEMALNTDIPATIADLAGIEQPASWHGNSLVPLISGKQKSLPRDTVLIEHLWEFENIPPSEGVRTNEWKYFRYVNDKSIEELYNLKDDPDETVNLAKNKAFAEVLHKLRKKCDAMTIKYADPYSGVPSGLIIETIRDPRYTEIIDPKPEFGWIVPQEAFVQKGYQILVASDEKSIDNNNGDVWDSGNVRSSQSANVELTGPPLKPNSTYYWKVRIFDQDNRLTEYSAPQKFKTGSFGETLTSANYFQIEKITPVEFRENSDGSYFADFGKAAFGTLAIEYHEAKKGTLTIRLGEKLQNGKIDRNPGGSIRYQETQLDVRPEKSSYQIELMPDERNTNERAVALPDSFPVIMPFRYAEIEGAGKIQAENIIQVAYFNYFDEGTSAFSSSNEILNQIWELCKYSIKATSFAGLYIDGERERIPYEADAYLNQLSHYGVDNEYAIARRTIEYFMKHPTWPTEWQLHVALLFYQDYMYTGNTELIEKYYEELKHKTLMVLEYHDGLISTSSPKLNGEFMAKLGYAL